jgi:hypothetical protein
MLKIKVMTQEQKQHIIESNINSIILDNEGIYIADWDLICYNPEIIPNVEDKEVESLEWKIAPYLHYINEYILNEGHINNVTKSIRDLAS